MTEVSFKLYAGAYETSSKTEIKLKLFAIWGFLLQFGFFLYLVFTPAINISLIIIFLINLVVPTYFLASAWLDRNYKYRRHLTFSDEGVIYRTAFLRDEQSFEWEEIEEVFIEAYSILFRLKNEEEHVIDLEALDSDSIINEIKMVLNIFISRKNIILS